MNGAIIRRAAALVLATAAAAGAFAADAAAPAPAQAQGTPAPPVPKESARPPAASPAAAPSAKEDPADAARKRAEALARTRQALAAATAGLAFEKTPPKDALARLAEAGKFSIVFDPALKDAGVDLAARPVTTRLSGITYDDALALILPKECGYRIEPGYVLVTALEKSWVPLAAVVYKAQLKVDSPPPVVAVGAGFPQAAETRTSEAGVSYRGPHPMRAAVTAGQSSQRASGTASTFITMTPPDPLRDAGPEQTIAYLKKMVRSQADRRIAPWDDEGGPAGIQYSSGRLIVLQTEHGHRAVAKLLAAVE
jgi:hypothetical protein